MVEVQDIKIIPEKREVKGVSTTVRASDFIPQYTEAVERFVRDNASLGKGWQEDALRKLYNFQGKNKEGDLLGSSPYMLALVSTYMPEVPLITGKQLLSVYQTSGNRNPFGSVYVDFGLNINGNPSKNEAQAEVLLENFRYRGVLLKNGRVVDLAQVRLEASEKGGLVFRLKDDIMNKDVANLEDYNFRSDWIGKNGLFGAYLYCSGGWVADGGGLADSNDVGRVVRYDAEGVACKKFEQDEISEATSKFRERF